MSLNDLHERLCDLLDEVKGCFKDRDGAKVTLVVRQTTIPGDNGVVIGDDDLDEAIREIEKRKNLPPTHGSVVPTTRAP